MRGVRTHHVVPVHVRLLPYTRVAGPDYMLAAFPSVVILSAKTVSSIGSVGHKSNT
jgi:hypothetical protein